MATHHHREAAGGPGGLEGLLSQHGCEQPPGEVGAFHVQVLSLLHQRPSGQQHTLTEFSKNVPESSVAEQPLEGCPSRETNSQACFHGHQILTQLLTSALLLESSSVSFLTMGSLGKTCLIPMAFSGDKWEISPTRHPLAQTAACLLS